VSDTLGVRHQFQTLLPVVAQQSPGRATLTHARERRIVSVVRGMGVRDDADVWRAVRTEAFGVRLWRFPAAVAICLLVAVLAVRGSGSLSSAGASVSPSGVLLFADYRGSLGTGVGGGVPGLYRINANGTSPRPLRGRFYLGDYPSWSPNGRQIVFARWLQPVERGFSYGVDIVVAAANGAAARVLVAHTDEWSWPAKPEWSASGDRIAYVNVGPSAQRIFITDATSGPFIGRGVVGSEGADSVSWSPGGDELTFSRGGSFAGVVYRLSAKGGTARVLVRHAHDPAWSPDGRQLASIGNRGGLYLLNLKTKGLRLVTHACAQASKPEWSPDGRWLAFADCGSNKAKAQLLTIARVDGSGRRVIFTSRAGIGSPSWH
jgi:Tol biopolymer transport system component